MKRKGGKEVSIQIQELSKWILDRLKGIEKSVRKKKGIERENYGSAGWVGIVK